MGGHLQVSPFVFREALPQPEKGSISKTVMEKRKAHLILLFESKTQEVSLEGNQNILRY